MNQSIFVYVMIVPNVFEIVFNAGMMTRGCEQIFITLVSNWRKYNEVYTSNTCHFITSYETESYVSIIL